MNPLLEMNDLSLKLGDFTLGPLSLSLAPGDYLVLLGPSGSGKSTLLSLVAGFLRPGAGRVLLDGREVSSAARVVPPRRRRIGMVFQDLGLWPHLTVERHLEFVLRANGFRGAERRRRVAAALDLLELRALASAKPDALSGGEAQRLAIGRALVAEPEVLLLDEPLGALDRRLRERLVDAVDDIVRERRLTTVWVTHEFDEARRLGTRVVVLDRGRVAQDGPVDEMYERPASRTVAELSGPVAFLDGVVGADGRIELAAGASVSTVAELPPGAEVTAVLRPDAVLLRPQAAGPGVVERRRGARQLTVRIGRESIVATADAAIDVGDRVELVVEQPVWALPNLASPARRP